MPIRIDRLAPDGQDNETVAWLCDDCWRLPEQGEALVAWVAEHGGELPAGEYAADIGFAPRDDAMGGGAAFPPSALRLMADLGMALYLSEYPVADAEPGATADGGV
ncbi:MAG: hypothetical protein JNM56_33490 [Planctomycetia bacterium]|nr:hypothetical protein [Planctomycetia bacterium]